MLSRICQFQGCEGLNISPASGVHKRLGDLTEHTSSAWILEDFWVRGGLLEKPYFPISLHSLKTPKEAVHVEQQQRQGSEYMT